MTDTPITPWSGDRQLAARYAALRHPALTPVRAVELPGGGLAVVARPAIAGPAADPAGTESESRRLDPADALRAVGEVALGLQALHDLGLVHGSVTAAGLRREGERWVLSGVARPATGTDRLSDVASLETLLVALAGPGVVADPRGRAVVTAVQSPAATAGDVGRTALALAAGAAPTAIREQPRTARATSPTGLPPSAAAAGRAAASHPELDAARRRTRNRMLLVAVVVVLVGAALLRLVDSHGIVKVPREIGRTGRAATTDLRHAGLVPRIIRTAAPGSRTGVVVAQSPSAGQQVRPGGTVQLRVAAAAGPS